VNFSEVVRKTFCH